MTSTDAGREAERLEALAALELLDTAPDAQFDGFAAAAAAVCGAPIGLIGLIDRDRVWFKAAFGCETREISRGSATCAYVLARPTEEFETADARRDARLCDDPHVTGPPYVRSYAGVPLVVDGYVTGVMCVMDTVPRRLAQPQRIALRAIARAVEAALAGRRNPNTSGHARIERALGPGRTLFLIELDRLVATNDSFGRAIGDRLLGAAEERIRDSFTGSVCGRLDGGRMAIVTARNEPPKAVATRLHDAFRVPFEIEPYRIASSISIGIAECGAVSSTAGTVRDAELALRGARERGGGATVFSDDEASRRRRRRSQLDYELYAGLDADEFALEYQPIVDARTHRIVKVEALLRWRHPDRGTILPTEFVPIAEDNDAIVRLGRLALRKACRDVTEFRAIVPRLRASVNVSARQLTDPLLLPTIGEALAENGLDPHALELEITESAIVRDPIRAATLLSEIRSTGIRIAIDDFGIGYSSLALLQRLPIDTLKIDRTFTAGLPGKRDSCAIVGAILALADRLRFDVVAEGVENAAQASYLLAAGCRLLQGYHYARPMPLEKLREALTHRID